jgi:hypothetical protein
MASHPRLGSHCTWRAGRGSANAGGEGGGGGGRDGGGGFTDNQQGEDAQRAYSVAEFDTVVRLMFSLDMTPHPPRDECEETDGEDEEEEEGEACGLADEGGER